MSINENWGIQKLNDSRYDHGGKNESNLKLDK